MNRTFIVSNKSLTHIVLVVDTKVVSVTDSHVITAAPLLKVATRCKLSDLDKSLQKEIADVSYQAEFDLYEWIASPPLEKHVGKAHEPVKPVKPVKSPKKAGKKIAQKKVK